MKRAPIVLSATVAGLAGTLAFQTRDPGTTPVATVQTTAAAPTGRTSSSGSSSSSGASSASGSSTTSATRTVTSAVVPNQYGNVQLELTVKGGKVTAITALQLPGNEPKSSEISSYAEPVLRQSALAAQSASIDSVSGATFTSASYKSALQSALVKAGIATSSSSTS